MTGILNHQFWVERGEKWRIDDPRRFVKRNKRITKYKKSVSDEVAKEVKGSLISQHYPRKKNKTKNSKKAQHQRGGGIVVVFISSFFFFSSLPGFNKKKQKKANEER